MFWIILWPWLLFGKAARWYIFNMYRILSATFQFVFKKLATPNIDSHGFIQVQSQAKDDRNETQWQLIMEGHIALVSEEEYLEEKKDSYVITAKKLRKFLSSTGSATKDVHIRYAALAVTASQLGETASIAPILCVYTKKALVSQPGKLSECLHLDDFRIAVKPSRFNRRNHISLESSESHALSTLRPKKFRIFAASGYELERWWYYITSAQNGSINSKENLHIWHKFLSTYESLRLKKLNGNIDSFGTLRRIGLHLARKTEQTDPDSSEWLNVIIGRAWMSVIETKSFSTRFSEKIVRKLESVKRPSFLSLVNMVEAQMSFVCSKGEIRLKKLDFGSFPPILHNLKMKERNYEDIQITADLLYRGDAIVQLETELTLDRNRKSRGIPITLEIIFEEIKGNVTIKFNPSPCDNLWWGFSEAPYLKLSITPLVADSNIGFGMVKEVLENRINSILEESVVLPNMENFSLSVQT